MAVRRPELRFHVRRRHLSLVLGVLVALLGLFASSTPTYAEPGTDDEGGTLTLREQLELAATNYYNAKATLTQSQQRQAEITTKLRDAELSLARLETEVATIAAGRYQGAQLNVLSGLFTGQGNPEQLLAGAALSDYLVWRDDEYLRQYRTAKDESELQRTLLDAEVAIQAKALADLDQQKRDAEKALASVGGMVSAGYNGPVPEAQAGAAQRRRQLAAGVVLDQGPDQHWRVHHAADVPHPQRGPAGRVHPVHQVLADPELG